MFKYKKYTFIQLEYKRIYIKLIFVLIIYDFFQSILSENIIYIDNIWHHHSTYERPLIFLIKKLFFFILFKF